MRALTKKDIGKSFTACIRGTNVRGKVQFEGERYFLCQDHINGALCKDKLGYAYSYTVMSGSVEDIAINQVDNLEIEDGVRWVYVSDVSEETALKNKVKRILLADIGEQIAGRYVCVANGSEKGYLKGEIGCAVSKWRYVVPVPFKENIIIPLNDNYKAVVSDKEVNVGCQTFDFEVVEKLWNAVCEMKK